MSNKNLDLNLSEAVDKAMARRKLKGLLEAHNGIIPLKALGDTRLGAWWNGHKYVIPSCTCAMGLAYNAESEELQCPQCKAGGKESDEVPRVG